MTEKELQAIRERAEAATEGPWGTGAEYEQSSRGNYVFSKAKSLIVAAEQDGTDCVLEKKDAEFIAASRQDVPKLLAEVDRLKAQFAHISDMAVELYEVDSVKNEWILPDSLEPYAEFIDEIFIVSGEEAGLVDCEEDE